jgi:hypothetical protein
MSINKTYLTNTDSSKINISESALRQQKYILQILKDCSGYILLLSIISSLNTSVEPFTKQNCTNSFFI